MTYETESFELACYDEAPASEAAGEAAAPAVAEGFPNIGGVEPKPVFEPNSEAAGPDAGAPVVVEYSKTGDPGLDMALGFVGKLGLAPEHPAMKAAADGDYSLIKAHLASLGAKAQGWEQYVALAEAAHARGAEAAKAKAAADLELVHQAAGGKEEWQAIATWAAKNAEPDERAAVNDALSKGGLIAKAMVSWLADKYRNAPGTTVNPAPARGPGAKPAAAASGWLSAADYVKEAQKLSARLGGAMDGHPEYQALQSRRMAAIRAGK